MKKLLSQFVNWFEGGELAPLIILISVPHYAGVLARFDFWPVAAALGFLLDLGHYRTIRAYQRGQGALWMVILTAFSFGFHAVFYWEGGAGLASIFFGAAVPVVIFALSFLSVAERWTAKARRAAEYGNISNPNSEPLPNGKLPELPKLPTANRGTFEEFSAAQLANPRKAKEIAAAYGIPLKTAYNWIGKLKAMEVEK